MMISYMIDGQGYLITNREIISAGTLSKNSSSLQNHKMNEFQAFKNKKWQFVSKIVLTYCEKKIVLVTEKNSQLEAEGREFANF